MNEIKVSKYTEKNKWAFSHPMQKDEERRHSRFPPFSRQEQKGKASNLMHFYVSGEKYFSNLVYDHLFFIQPVRNSTTSSRKVVNLSNSRVVK